MLRFRQTFLLLLPGLLLPTTGCLVRTRNILVEVPPDIVISADTPTLVKEVNDRYDAISTMTATVNLTATVDNKVTGDETEISGSRGYILINKPDTLRVRALIPILKTPAFDMVSDGKVFTMYIPPKNKAITGGMTVRTRSKSSYENLRPSMFIESMLIRSIAPDELVSVTTDTRVLDTNRKSHHVTVEPDYNIGVYRAKSGSNQLIPLRVIHISRRTMLPYQLDIYNDEGTVETQTTYDNYALYGKVKYPTKITIERPLEGLTVELDVVSVEFNQPFEDGTFKLDVPDGTPVEKLP